MAKKPSTGTKYYGLTEEQDDHVFAFVSATIITGMHLSDKGPNVHPVDAVPYIKAHFPDPLIQESALADYFYNLGRGNADGVHVVQKHTFQMLQALTEREFKGDMTWDNLFELSEFIYAKYKIAEAAQEAHEATKAAMKASAAPITTGPPAGDFD